MPALLSVDTSMGAAMEILSIIMRVAYPKFSFASSVFSALTSF
jgi:hypothetical protein